MGDRRGEGPVDIKDLSRNRAKYDKGVYSMAYVITSPCKDEKAAECVEVCPVDAIHGDDVQYYIDPDTCIDCGACEPVCPVEAIYQEDMVPEEEQEYIEINANFFK
jgi:NAD-dependent dihydropyrimidine dehydrogenase PreA subunit